MRAATLAVMAASTILAMVSPSFAAAQDVPAFRVPLGSAPSTSGVPATYSWLQQVGNCSTTCGTGTRTTTYQCQNVADYDYAGAGYGLPEPDAMCSASSGPKPADTGSSCTVYSGCGYDWVKPPVVQTPKALDGNPVGRIGCGFVNRRFSPYCQRTGGGTNVVLASGDYRFCSNDRPDYDDVASGSADALGFDRDGSQTGSCNTTDHDWRSESWGSWNGGGAGDCDSAATRSRTVACYRRFDNSIQPDASCDADSRPAATETAARYGSCSYSFSYGAWSDWSSTCDTNAKRSRTASCTRSNNGGQTVADAECTNRGITKESVNETSPQYGSCSYEFKTSAWSAYDSSCSANALRTRDVWCQRSNGDRVGDAECTNRSQAKPTTSESAAQYGSCTYNWSQSGFGAWSSGCSNSATRTQTVTCRRDLDGATVADSFCNAGTRPASSQTSGQYSTCGYSAGGTPTAWSGWNSACSPSATRTRQYQCVRSNDGGQIVADGECTSRGVNLTESQTGANYASCSYSWAQGGFGAWSSTCSNTATRTQSVWCRRDVDGTTVADGNCNAGARPASSQTTGQYSGCSYTAGGTPSGWSGWNSGCSASATRTRQFQCVRNNDGGQIVADGDCTGRGVNLTESQSGANYASCTYHLEDAGVGACNGTNRPHYWRCVRDLDGTQVDSSTFCGRPNPTYESCSYTYSLRDAGLGACQTDNRAPHYWGCVRDQTGEQVDSATYCGRSNPTYESCSYPWTYRLEDAGVGACNGTNKPHYWNCIREQDGTRVDSSTYCGRANPTYESCSFTYTLGDAGTGACQTNDQAPHYWNCRRNETGEMVDSATFCGRSNPTYDACSYPWTYAATNWSGWGTCTNGQQTETAQCQRGDGTVVGSEVCNSRGIATTRSQACSSGPNVMCTIRIVSYGTPQGGRTSAVRSCYVKSTGAQRNGTIGNWAGGAPINTSTTPNLAIGDDPGYAGTNCRYIGDYRTYGPNSSPPPGWGSVWPTPTAPGSAETDYFSQCD